jgi:hypothetical protein
MQVTGENVQNGAEIVDSIESSFRDSVEKYVAYDNELTGQCNRISERSEKRNADFKNNEADLNKSVLDMNAENKVLAESNESANKNIREYLTKVDSLKQQGVEDRNNVQEQTVKNVESQRVLKRLSNLVQDELTGNQRTATIGQYNTDKSLSGYSFLEVHNQLKGLNAQNAIVKSMISTLIMITQDQKNLFANQESVKKIQHVIDQLLRHFREQAVSLREESQKRQEEFRSAAENLATSVAKFRDTIANNNAQIAANTRQVQSMKAEIASMQIHIANANKRSKSNFSLCNNLKKMIGIHKRVMEEGNKRMNELRQQLA